MREPKESTPAPPFVLDPAAWEDEPVLRETCLFYITDPEVNAALRVLARACYDMLLEYYHHWPSWSETTTRTEVRAAIADLRHLEGFLGALGREHEEAALEARDAALSRTAGEQAGEIRRIADLLEAALGREP